MNDINYQLRRSYYQSLNTLVVFNSQPVRFYDKFAPNDAVYPYVILSTQTDVEDSVKNTQGHSCSMLVDIVTGFTGEVQSEPMDDIAGQIQSIINPAVGRLAIGGGFQLIRTRKISDNTLESQNGTYKILRRLLRFDHIIHEQVQV